MFAKANLKIYFKAENLVIRARSESFGFAEIVNKDRMVGTKAQRHKGIEAQRHRGTEAQRHRGTEALSGKGTEAQRNKVSRFRGFKGSSDIENKHRLKHIDVQWNNFSFVVEFNF